MRFPRYGWLEHIKTEQVGNSLYVTVRPRKWHPYYWTIILRALFKGLFR